MGEKGGPAIRADGLTYIFTFLAVMVAVYLATFDMGALILFPVVLLISGVTLQIYLSRKVHVDDRIDRKEGGEIMFYALVCMAVIAVSSFFVAALPTILPNMELTATNTVLFGILMAISEEQFFRGAVTSFLLQLTVPSFAILGSGAIFAAYHLAVYGTSVSSMVYVMVAGIVLAWAAYRSQRLSPGILAHIANNILATVI